MVQSGDPVQDEEDVCAAAVATYIVLLAAHARGLAGYWRTPDVLRTPEGRAALGVGDDERVLGLIHLGRAQAGARARPSAWRPATSSATSTDPAGHVCEGCGMPPSTSS